MENRKKEMIKNVINIAIIIVISAILSIFLLNDKLDVFRDDGIQHIIRIEETANNIRNMESSKVYNNLCNGFGYSWDLFYGNFTSLIPGVICLIIGSPVIAFKIFLFLLLLFSGITMYISCLRIFKKKELAIIASIIYVCAPYHLNDMYVRFAIAEFASFVFIPLVFAGLNSILKDEKNKDYLLLVIGASGLIITHLLSTVITALFALVYIICNYKSLKDKNVIKKLAISLVVILLLTAYYWIPMLESTLNTKYEVYEENKMSTVESVNRHRVEVKNLISSKDYFQVHEIGALTIILILLSVYSVKKIEKENIKNYIIFLIFGMFSVIMTTYVIDWSKMPKFLLMIQFPWRMLEFSTCFLSIVASISFYYALKKVKYIDVLYVMVIAVLFSSILKYKITYKDEVIENPKIGVVHEKSMYGTNAGAAKFEYLPKKAYENIEYIATRSEGIEIISGEATINQFRKNGKILDAEISHTEDIVVELPYIYYIGYNVYINGEKTKNSESEKGFIEIAICKNDNAISKIETKYTGTISMKISCLLSISGIIILAVYIIKKEKYENIDIANNEEIVETQEK